MSYSYTEAYADEETGTRYWQQVCSNKKYIDLPAYMSPKHTSTVEALCKLKIE